MNSFLSALQQTTNYSRTENNAVAFCSTLDACLDFFALGGAKRGNQEQALRLFARAYADNKQTALRILFYLRDIRGGQGERQTFRTCLADLYQNDIAVFEKIIPFVPEYGRWDDLIAFVDNPQVVDLVKNQLDKDNTSEQVSLLAKWLPSENCSNQSQRQLARKWAKKLGLSLSLYRKTLVALRQKINILESKMTAKQWQEIEYDKLPSLAFAKHTKAFHRNDEKRFQAYLQAVAKGEKKINTATLYCYQIVQLSRSDPQSAAVLWQNLPDYTRDENAMVVADVSGSMYGTPMDMSVSLALYFAERNRGAFHNYFMTFSERPQLVQISGLTLAQKISNIEQADWGYNTNLEAVFDTILQAAIKAHSPQQDMPAVIYIISDMEFDECCQNSNATVFHHAKQQFENAGYNLPQVVFWNVASRSNQTLPVTRDDTGVVLVSGASQVTFELAVAGKSPLDLMNEVVNSERYQRIVVE